jgi:hypothetical protein
LCKTFSKNTNAKVAASKNELAFVVSVAIFLEQKIKILILTLKLVAKKWIVCKVERKKFKHGVLMSELVTTKHVGIN